MLFPVNSKGERLVDDSLVIGWIRTEIEKKYKNSNIPYALKQLCFKFWLIKICDQWDLTYYDKKRILISNNGLTASAKDNTSCSIYSKREIDIGDKYIWTLKMNSWFCEWSSIIGQPYIGIIKSDEKILNRCKINGPSEKDGYWFSASKAALHFRKFPAKKIQYGQRVTCKGDVIEMCVDLRNNTVSYRINGTDYGVAYSNIDRCRYRLYVGFYHGKGTSLQLI